MCPSTFFRNQGLEALELSHEGVAREGVRNAKRVVYEKGLPLGWQAEQL